MLLNSKQIAQYTSATVLVEAMDPSRLATSITWDSREVQPGGVYVALPGERVDGHDFIKDSLKAGALVILAMHKPTEPVCALAREMGASILEVGSTFTAFTSLAAEYRRHHLANCKVVALTGSTGKTTTKNLVRSVFSTSLRTVATKGNQNNELGVPRTLLEANPDTEVIVVEMGMRGMGQIESLCEFVRPDVALITNTGECHIELLGSRENIARAKAEAVQALPNHVGRAILNAVDGNYEFVRACAQVEHRGIEVYSFDGSGNGTSETAAVFATDVVIDEEGKPSFNLHFGNGAVLPCSLQLRGAHNVHNACAAAAADLALSIPEASIVEGLEAALPEVGRQHVATNRDGVVVVDDAYNANPDSMRASLRMFAAMKVEGKRYAVLGDMGELGSFAVACHKGIGTLVPELPIDCLICVGELAQNIASAALEAGMPEQRVVVSESRGSALAYLEERLEKGDAVLVKASHSMELDKLVKGLLN